MNGPKTIGRTKPAPDLTKVNDIARAVEEVASGVAPMTPRERAFHLENIQLKRELAVMTARNNVMMAGEKGNRPIGNAWERANEFERRIEAADRMRPREALKELKAMAKDVATHKFVREQWQAEVERQTERALEHEDVKNDP